MDLPERKKKILQAIIRTYLETGEPVGSRTISKFTDLKLSSATIRNEMSDLEEMGLIVQPHTSAGRIPTDKGYRLYVDELLEEKNRQVDDMKSMLLEHEDKLENLLKQAAKLLANNTNYASMISMPTVGGNKIKFIQLSQVDVHHVLAVIVIEGNLVRNSMIEVNEVFDSETLLKLNMLLNSALDGLTVESIPEIYTSGADNIFRYPELADQSRASQIIGDFEEKEVLGNIVRNTLEDSDQKGIQVYIGDEVPSAGKGMEDCSVVTTTYDLGDGMKGTIGIVGPKRMDYDKVVDALKNVMHQLEDYYKK